MMTAVDEMRAELVVEAAIAWLGTPYRHQGSLKGVGCDCLGLVRGVWRELYGAEPEDPGPYAADWAEAGGEDKLLEAARRYCCEKPGDRLAAGDLVIFRWRPNAPAKHAGIMVAPDSFIHAYQGQAVLVSALVPHWRRRIAGVFSFPSYSSKLDLRG